MCLCQEHSDKKIYNFSCKQDNSSKRRDFTWQELSENLKQLVEHSLTVTTRRTFLRIVAENFAPLILAVTGVSLCGLIVRVYLLVACSVLLFTCLHTYTSDK